MSVRLSVATLRKRTRSKSNWNSSRALLLSPRSLTWISFDIFSWHRCWHPRYLGPPVQRDLRYILLDGAHEGTLPHLAGPAAIHCELLGRCSHQRVVVYRSSSISELRRVLQIEVPKRLTLYAHIRRREGRTHGSRDDEVIW